MKWFARGLIAFAILLVPAVAVPFFIPLGGYIPRIEKQVSARLKEPVSIKSMELTALPLPHVTVEGITVGTTADVKLGIVGGIGEVLFFTVFDPHELYLFGEITTLSRLAVYSVGSFLCWAFAAASSAFTLFLARSVTEVNR